MYYNVHWAPLAPQGYSHPRVHGGMKFWLLLQAFSMSFAIHGHQSNAIAQGGKQSYVDKK